MTRFRSILYLIPFFLLFVSTSYSKEAKVASDLEPTKESKQEQSLPDIKRISEAFGHMIGENLNTLEIDFDIDKVVQGLVNSSKGEKSPMKESEWIQAVSAIQEKKHKEEAEKNLAKADRFMEENVKEKDIVELEKGALHYQIREPGKGNPVEEHSSPLISYKGTLIDGRVFAEFVKEQRINIDEMIPGFKEGVIGMKEGEKRTLYIHPTLGYGTEGYLPPNSLLVFDVEVLKANVPAKKESDLNATTASEKPKTSDEIADLSLDSTKQKEQR